ncbi:MAG TPA: sodium:calcium antiporter, partial [Lachnospiraceae bacterium]|nr:sodium:calcium antiporter [Lachnospiraceae bacterium]
IIENIRSAKKESVQKKTDELKIRPDKKEITINILKFVIGTVGIVWGADLLVDNGSELARIAGISESIIGVTLVAVGTSLPELVTTITAILKKQSSLSIGNIIGANIIDLTIILPLCAIVSGKALPVSTQMTSLDMPVCIAVGLIAMVPALISQKFHRWQGVLLLACYAVYMGVLFI